MELDGREDETFDLPAVSILAGTTLNPCIFLYSWCVVILPSPIALTCNAHDGSLPACSAGHSCSSPTATDAESTRLGSAADGYLLIKILMVIWMMKMMMKEEDEQSELKSGVSTLGVLRVKVVPLRRASSQEEGERRRVSTIQARTPARQSARFIIPTCMYLTVPYLYLVCFHCFHLSIRVILPCPKPHLHPGPTSYKRAKSTYDSFSYLLSPLSLSR